MVPLPFMCRYSWWLAIWAILGRRSSDTRGMDWQETLQWNSTAMQVATYPSKRTLRRIAAAVGIEVSFVEKQLLRTEDGRRGKLYRRLARLGLGPIAGWLLSMTRARVMVWAK